MSHADYLRGQADADLHNRIFRSGAYAGEASEILHHKEMDDLRKELNANANGINQICFALKTELHKVDPVNPLVNPITQNPILNQIYENGKNDYLKTQKQTPIPPAIRSIAADQGCPIDPAPAPAPEKRGFFSRLFGGD